MYLNVCRKKERPRERAAGNLIMTGQSSRCTHSAGHSSIRTYSFELYGERIDPNLSQSHEKVKEEDQYLCSNGNSFNRPCKNRRAFSFKLFSEKIDPNLNQSNEKLKIEDDHNHRFLNGNGNSLRRSSISMGILDACNYDPDFMDNGYLSDGLPNGSSHYIHDKKKGLFFIRINLTSALCCNVIILFDDVYVFSLIACGS